MRIEDLDARWHELTEDVITGMKKWRLQHPKATFREIEATLDERLARVRAQMLKDSALLSRAAEWQAEGEGEALTCPAEEKRRGKQPALSPRAYGQGVASGFNLTSVDKMSGPLSLPLSTSPIAG